MIELELTYLAKTLPIGLSSYPHKEIVDCYLPHDAEHPKLRLRRSGEKYEMTKKTLLQKGDASTQQEQTITLSQEEFLSLLKLPSKKVEKRRYYYDYQGKTTEIDVFQGDLKGLIVIDFEFTSEQEKNDFLMPDRCLADITQETFIAGGMICGKSYQKIEKYVKKFNYKPLFI